MRGLERHSGVPWQWHVHGVGEVGWWLRWALLSEQGGGCCAEPSRRGLRGLCRGSTGGRHGSCDGVERLLLLQLGRGLWLWGLWGLRHGDGPSRYTGGCHASRVGRKVHLLGLHRL